MDLQGRPWGERIFEGWQRMSSTSGTQAVDRAAGLLLTVMEARDPMTFTELQDSSELAKSTLSRLLSSLERHDLVTRGEDGSVRPGGALTRFAHSRRPTDELIEAAQQPDRLHLPHRRCQLG
jgi:DNA-binding IclR family transcriptional regulator